MRSPFSSIKLFIIRAPNMMSPKTRDTYRQVPKISLIFFFIFVLASLSGIPNKEINVSRMSFLEKIKKIVSNSSISESEAMSCGLIEPCSDGKFHLDWPVSRSVAIKILQSILAKVEGFKTRPGKFSDIGRNSVMFETLNMVGGFFAPLDHERFKSNAFISEKEAEGIYSALKKSVSSLPSKSVKVDSAKSGISSSLTSVSGVASNSGTTAPGSVSSAISSAVTGNPSSAFTALTTTLATTSAFFSNSNSIQSSALASTPLEAYPASATEFSGTHFSSDFKFPAFPTNPSEPKLPLDPSFQGDLKIAEDGAHEMDERLNSLEVDVAALTDSYIENPEDLRALDIAIQEIYQVLRDCSEKIRYTEFNIDHSKFDDSESSKKAQEIASRLREAKLRISKLEKRISDFQKNREQGEKE
ncbi:MAG: hypothetical protein HQM08_20645 [Candidatus Riflebacteria bacterium]|nr:hypothetical protein [Candidatus Riflebacteria bacterium]